MTTARDAILTNGLTVALVMVVLVMLLAARRNSPIMARTVLPSFPSAAQTRKWALGAAAVASLMALVWFVTRPTSSTQWPGTVITSAEMAASDAAAMATDASAAADAYAVATDAAMDAENAAYDDAATQRDAAAAASAAAAEM